jgi:type II secretory pathway pseudopilin PulG
MNSKHRPSEVSHGHLVSHDPAQQASRRGFMLFIVVVVMTIVGGLLVALSFSSAALYRDRQVDRIRAAARTVSESAALYARAQQELWTADGQEGEGPSDPRTIELDVARLLPTEMRGSAVLTVSTAEERIVCRVIVRVVQGAYEVEEAVDVIMTRER